jgi:hypothetical protein
MTSPRGRPTALACHPTKSKKSQITNLSLYKHWVAVAASDKYTSLLFCSCNYERKNFIEHATYFLEFLKVDLQPFNMLDDAFGINEPLNKILGRNSTKFLR